MYLIFLEYTELIILTLQVKLSPLHDVTVNRFKVNDIVRYSDGDRRDVVRNLLMEIMGVEKLQNACASTIPSDVLESVKYCFV